MFADGIGSWWRKTKWWIAVLVWAIQDVVLRAECRFRVAVSFPICRSANANLSWTLGLYFLRLSLTFHSCFIDRQGSGGIYGSRIVQCGYNNSWRWWQRIRRPEWTDLHGPVAVRTVPKLAQHRFLHRGSKRIQKWSILPLMCGRVQIRMCVMRFNVGSILQLYQKSFKSSIQLSFNAFIMIHNFIETP